MTTMNHAPPADPALPTENAPAKDPEQQWLETVYRKGEKQLTVRAIIAGMLIGGVMCLSNLYVFFKTGWSLGVTLTACILAFAVFELFRAADACIVSSLHDGMNLVAKEFVASRDDERGVLILSTFAGASRELPEPQPSPATSTVSPRARRAPKSGRT